MSSVVAVLPVAFKLFAGVVAGIGFYSLVFDSEAQILENIANSISTIVELFISLYDLFIHLIDLFPGPFSQVVKLFLTLMFPVFLWKLWKGGG